MTEISKGADVRFTHGPIGLLSEPNAYKFADPVVRAGDYGTYIGTHPTLDDWHMVAVEVAGDILYAPVSRSQFEVA